MATNIAFPYLIDGRGRTAEPPDLNTHITELIEQLLFTNPGERVNRNNFGSGLLQSVFAPNSAELAAAMLEELRNERQPPPPRLPDWDRCTNELLGVYESVMQRPDTPDAPV